jgi:hypothetical protein
MTTGRGNNIFGQLRNATFSTTNPARNTMKGMFWPHGEIPLLLAPVSTRPHLCKKYLRREFTPMHFASFTDNF